VRVPRTQCEWHSSVRVGTRNPGCEYPLAPGPALAPEAGHSHGDRTLGAGVGLTADVDMRTSPGLGPGLAHFRE